jgi:hypothetical protein
VNIYEECLNVQDASNYMGVALDFGRIAKTLCEERDWMNGTHRTRIETATHPVALWWANKMLSLAGVCTCGWKMTLAYEALKDLAGTRHESPERAARLMIYQHALDTETRRRMEEFNTKQAAELGIEITRAEKADVEITIDDLPARKSPYAQMVGRGVRPTVGNPPTGGNPPEPPPAGGGTHPPPCIR